MIDKGKIYNFMYSNNAIVYAVQRVALDLPLWLFVNLSSSVIEYGCEDADGEKLPFRFPILSALVWVVAALLVAHVAGGMMP